MRFQQVSLRHFRSFGEVEQVIDFSDSPYPTSIIGNNNSGKTNLLASMLYATGVWSSYGSSFTDDDFFGCDTSEEARISIRIDPPLKSTDAYNNIKEMPVLRLRLYSDQGSIETKHDCCDDAGKPVYNARSLRKSNTKVYTDEEKEVMTAYQRSGAERVHKWRSKIPVFYLGPETLSKELKPNRFSLLGKVIESFRKEFESEESTMPNEEGVVSAHVGKPRATVYKQAMRYIEDHVIPTVGFRAFVEKLEEVVREQLDVEQESFEVRFRPPGAEAFYNNLRFDVRENENRPLIPVDRMGAGFVSLFVVAILRVLVDTDEGGKIFILEEPETYLHEHFQEYFYEVLCDLAMKNQVIYTTHSKKFVNVFQPESIVRLSAESEGTKVIVPAAGHVELSGEIDGFKVRNPKDYAKFMRTLEPNLGNIAFANRVVVVEGPHDLLAYRTVLSTVQNLGLKNTALVSAWGKDPICTVLQMCQALEIPCFAIHDRDIPNEVVDDAKGLDATLKAQLTKNQKIRRLVGDAVHLNRPNLEGSLGIEKRDKSVGAVFAKIEGKSLEKVREEFPGLIPDGLLAFLGIDT